MAIGIETAARRISSVNPATGEVLREFGCATTAEVQEAVFRARAAQPEWRARAAMHHRLTTIENFQNLLNERKQAIARTITLEVGKPIAEALLTEILVVLDTCRFLLREGH